MNEQKKPAEAAYLARIILDDSEDEHPTALYALNVREARTLARAALAADRVEELADRLEANASELEADGADDYAEAARTDARSIRAALNGETDA